MQRRRHPHYARHTFSVSALLIGGAIGCFLVGRLVRYTAFAGLEFILNIAFVAAVVGLLFYWFAYGESTVCPGCGRRLFAEKARGQGDPVSFVCSDCGVEWLTGGEIDDLESD
jgi:hypothetical protein